MDARGANAGGAGASNNGRKKTEEQGCRRQAGEISTELSTALFAAPRSILFRSVQYNRKIPVMDASLRRTRRCCDRVLVRRGTELESGTWT